MYVLYIRVCVYICRPLPGRWFVACGAELAEVRVEGLTTWKNPHGYLPGMMASYMPFFGYMSIAFLSLGAAWLALYCYNWRDVIPLQHCVTALIFLGMMEMSTWCGLGRPLSSGQRARTIRTVPGAWELHRGTCGSKGHLRDRELSIQV